MEDTYSYEDCKSKPYVEKSAKLNEVDLFFERQIHELENDLNEVTEIYDHETDQIRSMMIEKGDQFRIYMAQHEAAYFIVTDQMDRVQKAEYGEDNFERLGFGLAQIKYMTTECRAQERQIELGLYVAPEAEQENQPRSSLSQSRSLSQIMALSDKEKRECGYPVFTNMDSEKHERVFGKRVEIERDKLDRQAEKGVERN